MTLPPELSAATLGLHGGADERITGAPFVAGPVFASAFHLPGDQAGVRHGACPTAQSTSSIRPHPVQTAWWWLSLTRVSYRAGEFGVSILRSSPLTVRSESTT